MKDYLSIKEIINIQDAIAKCKQIKQNPYANPTLGKNKTIGLIFLNQSLRTKISTIKAAQNLGLNVLPIELNNMWGLEFDEGAIMNTDKAEHIKEATQVIASYCDIIAIRAFANLKDKQQDAKELLFSCFKKYTNVSLINLESALRHPLQSLADILTIEEYKKIDRPKVVLTWAPHVKALPHAVPNSFAEAMQLTDYDFTIVQPHGYELDAEFTGNAKISYNQDEALENADFIYVKNWSSTKEYGQVTNTDTNWTIRQSKIPNNAKVMHCLPVRRNLVISDDVLDSDNSVVIEQAHNRLYSAQYVLSEIIQNLS